MPTKQIRTQKGTNFKRYKLLNHKCSIANVLLSEIKIICTHCTCMYVIIITRLIVDIFQHMLNMECAGYVILVCVKIKCRSWTWLAFNSRVVASNGISGVNGTVRFPSHLSMDRIFTDGFFLTFFRSIFVSFRFVSLANIDSRRILPDDIRHSSWKGFVRWSCRIIL